MLGILNEWLTPSGKEWLTQEWASEYLYVYPRPTCNRLSSISYLEGFQLAQAKTGKRIPRQ